MTAIFSRLVLIGVCAWLCTAVPEADASGPHHPSAKPRSHATEHAKAASWLRDGRFMVETVQRKLHRLLAAGFEIPLNLRGGFNFKGSKEGSKKAGPRVRINHSFNRKRAQNASLTRTHSTCFAPSWPGSHSLRKGGVRGSWRGEDYRR